MVPRAPIRLWTRSFGCFIIIALRLAVPTYAYWDDYAYGNGVWFKRKMEAVGGGFRDGTTEGVYDCHVLRHRGSVMNSGTSDVVPLDGAVVWNRPQEPAVLALAIYGDTVCGRSRNDINSGNPYAVIVLDKSKLRGIHLANFKLLDGRTPPAFVRSMKSKSAKALRVRDALKPGGVLSGIPPEQLPGSLIWWSTDGERHVLENAIAWENGQLYEGIQVATTAHKLLREIVERAVNSNPDTPRLNSKLVMRRINIAAGLSGTTEDLDLPAPRSNLDLRLDAMTTDNYGDNAPGDLISGAPIWTPAFRIGTGWPSLNAAAPPVNSQRLEVENQAHESQFMPIDNPGNPNLQLDPNIQTDSGVFGRGPLFDDVVGVPEDLLQVFRALEREVRSYDAGTADSTLEPAVARLIADFAATPNKSEWLQELESQERLHMINLLVTKDLYTEYEEKRHGLLPGSLNRPGAWVGASADVMAPGMRGKFAGALEKQALYKSLLAQQKMNLTLLDMTRSIYHEWVKKKQSETSSMHGMQGTPNQWDEISPLANDQVLVLEEKDDIKSPELEEYPGDEEEVLDQGQQDAVIEEDSEDAPSDEHASVDRFFSSADSPTIIRSDEVNFPRLQLTNPQAPSQAGAHSAIQVPTNNQEAQNTIPNDILHLQTEGIDPNTNLINDFLKYFDPNSRALQDILKFNPQLVEEITGGNMKLLGIPDSGRSQGFGDPPLVDTTRATGNDMNEEFEEEPRESEASLEEGQGSREVEEESSEGEILEERPVPQQDIMEEEIEEAREEAVRREDIREEERKEELVREAREEEASQKNETRTKPEENTTEQEVPATELLLGGRPIDDVMGEVQRQLQIETPRRPNTRYGGVRGSQTGSKSQTNGSRNKNKASSGHSKPEPVNMADVIIEIPISESPPIEESAEFEEFEPTVRPQRKVDPNRIDYWETPLKRRRNRNTIVENRGQIEPVETEPVEETEPSPARPRPRIDPNRLDYWDKLPEGRRSRNKSRGDRGQTKY